MNIREFADGFRHAINEKIADDTITVEKVAEKIFPRN